MIDGVEDRLHLQDASRGGQEEGLAPRRDGFVVEVARPEGVRVPAADRAIDVEAAPVEHAGHLRVHVPPPRHVDARADPGAREPGELPVHLGGREIVPGVQVAHRDEPRRAPVPRRAGSDAVPAEVRAERRPGGRLVRAHLVEVPVVAGLGVLEQARDALDDHPLADPAALHLHAHLRAFGREEAERGARAGGAVERGDEGEQAIEARRFRDALRVEDEVHAHGLRALDGALGPDPVEQAVPEVAGTPREGHGRR
jgi:hypothetical protein